MSGKITNDAPSLWNAVNTDSQSRNLLPGNDGEQQILVSDFAGANSKLFEANANARQMRGRVTASYAQNNPAAKVGAPDLAARADNLKKIFERGVRPAYNDLAAHIEGLSETDAKQLRAVYQQKTGRDLLVDVANHLFMDDTLRAFRVLAPERIHAQTEPQAMGTSGRGIKMDPPTTEILQGAQVQYALALPGEIGGDRKVSHLIRGENANLEEAGASFTADYQEEKDYGITFQVRYGNQPPEFYTYGVTVKNANDKAAGELSNLAGSAPDSELYLKYLDGQIGDTKQAISELETRRDAVYADIRGGIGNSADKYTEVRAIEKQLGALKSQLPEMETARAEVSGAFSNSIGKPIPLKAVLIAKENGQTIPLQLYAKNLGGGKWAIVDVTNPSKPRTWTGEGALPADALNQAWSNFVGGTNDLPAGQIAAQQPNGLGFQENKIWNSRSSGQSTLKQWSNGLGAGSIALAVLGVAAIFGPGTQGAAVPLLLGSGVLGGASAGTNLADRARNGTFEWKSTETAFDMLGIVGGVASLGGIGAMTNVGRTVVANGAKYTVQNLGNFTRIAQIAEQGTNAAGGILIANQYVSAIDKVNRSPMSAEQKAAETGKIITQAVAAGGLMVLGVGLGRKFAAPSETELNLLLKNANLGADLEQLVRNNAPVQKFFAARGKEELNQFYNEYLLSVKTGRLKANSFEQYLEMRAAEQISGRRNLDSHEGVSGVQQGRQVGHTVLKHVGKSESALQSRVRNKGIPSASSFHNYEVGNRTVGTFKKQYEAEINQWLKSNNDKPFKAVIDMQEGIGLVVNTNKKGTPLAAVEATKAEIILVKDNSKHGWHLFTVKLQK